MKRALQGGGLAVVGLGVMFLLFAVFGVGGGAAAPGEGGGEESLSGEVTCDFHCREKVISGAYKVYGNPQLPLWLAKTVLRNETDESLSDLKIRYKLDGYCDWSQWTTYPVVVPTQTIVDLYYPILSEKCAELRNRTPTDLLMEYEYTTADGEVVRDRTTRRLTVLSRHEFYYTDLKQEELSGSFQDFQTYTDLLAAWVTKSDPPVTALASLANEKAGGVGASQDDEKCIKVLEQIYEIMRTVGITYQHPAAQREEDQSFNILLIQDLQYPRDTIQKRSGTCIDLAILMAAMMKSVGVEPLLVSMRGHVFPMAKLPSGQYLPIESTGVGGGGEQSVNFAQAVQSGQKTLQELFQTGQFYITDCEKCWRNGITPPELEPLPADVLDRWGITEAVRGGGGGGGRGRDVIIDRRGGGGDGGDGGGGGRTFPLAEQWQFVVQSQGRQTPGVAVIQASGNTVNITFGMEYQMQAQDGSVHQCREVNTFQGTLSGHRLTATCRQGMSAWTIDGQDVQPQGLPFQLQLQFSAEGRSAQGTVTNAGGMSAQIQMQAQ
ncbi:MAG: transglutaminase-like domain-containing protein [Planctomycetota bacterium]